MRIATVDITHPEKIMYPKLKVTKQDVAEYYAFIAKLMVPLIKNRPLSLKQYPDNIAHEGYFHKHVAAYYPEYIQRLDFPSNHHGTVVMVGITNAKGLVYLAGQNTIEFHMALATVKKINCPDQIILDLDPSDNDFAKVRKVALITRDILDAQGFQSFVKTSGSRGLHIHIPIQVKADYAQVKASVKQLAEYIQTQCPDLTTTEFRKNKRGNKIFLDYLRNDHSATAIAPYSLRANEWAGIATPISWDEVQNNKKLTPYIYNINNIRERIAATPNPWQAWQ